MNWLHFREPVSAWTHFAWLVLAVPGTLVLWRLSRNDTLKRIGLLIFGLTLMYCYFGSWLYHSVPARIVAPFAAADHIGIYLLIAGTTTPIGLVVMRGWWRVGLLTGIWGLALTGIGLRLTAKLPINLMTIFYLIMGWVGCSAYFELVRCLSSAKVRPIWIGGIFYTLGAIINGARWPVLAPGVFDAHDLFHLFVMTGSLCHYYFMLSAIVPYQAPSLTAPSSAAPMARREPALQPALVRASG